MKIKIWGARGSIPSPLKSREIENKLFDAIFGMPKIDTTDPQAVRQYIASLPVLLRGTAGGNTTCVEVQAQGETIIIDAGSGIRDLGLELMKGPCGRGQGTLHLLFSHLHWDHIQGFPFFVPAFIPGNRIFIYSLHDAHLALNDQQRPLNFPVQLNHMQADIQFKTLQVGQPFQIGAVTVNTLENAHPGKAYSFRFEDQHNIFVQSSDSEHKRLDEASLQPYVEFFRDADALIFDAQYTLEDVWHHKVDWGHSSAMIGVDLARAAGVKQLLLFHHEPNYADVQLENIRTAAVAYQAQQNNQPACDILIAYEGMTLDLTPPGTVNFQFSADGRAAILTPTRIFDEQGVDQLSQQLAQLKRGDTAANSIIDLSQVERLTTASLKSLVTMEQTRRGEAIVMAAPSAAVRQVIELGGFADYFAIYPSVEAALAAVQTREALNLPGQLIKNRYQIHDKLTTSPLGTVLKAADTQSNLLVSLKLLTPTFSQETLNQFLRQAPQVMALDHQTIARVIDCDHEGEHYFVVEEFIEGQTLADALASLASLAGNSPALSPERCLDIALNLNLALEHSHSRGVIHGNLDPENILLTDQGLKISGFGQGRLVEGHNLLDAPFLHLKAAYLAPEQILGQPLDARTDLYGLGVVLYQLFTGRLPFEGSEQAIMQAHLYQAPRSPRDLQPDISLALEHLILKLLAKNPNDRYASAEQTRRVASSSMAKSNPAPQYALVGRDQQLSALGQCWSEAGGGRGQLVLIAGESGIGKSSLAQQAAAQCAPPVLLTGRCHELEGSPAYHPFAQLLQSYMASAPPEFYDDESRKLLGNFIRLAPQLRQVLPDIVEPPALDPRLEQLRLMTSLTQFIRRATARRPWLILLENLQWADPSSLELLRYLAFHLPSMALMIIGTYRDTELASDHPLTRTILDLSSGQSYHHLQLNRLSLSSVSQLLARLWQQSVPASFTETIYQHTEGNPFYVEEIARGLMDDGLITRDETGWHFPVMIDNLPLPHSVQEAVWRRVRRLSSGTQTILRQASVLGQTFRFEQLQALSGLSEWEVMEHLDLALEQQLIHELAGQDAFRFSHTEIQNVLYIDLNALRRRMLHHQAGEFLEQRSESGSERPFEELARHFTEAGEFARAITYSTKAGQQAQATYANETALLWYNKALTMFDQLTTEETARLRPLQDTVHESLGGLLTLLGRYDEALHHYLLVDEQMTGQTTLTVETKTHLIKLYQQIAEVHKKLAAFETAFNWLEKGLQYIDQKVAPTTAVASLYLNGTVLYLRQGKTQLALPWCEKGLALASQIETIEGQQMVGQAYYILGNIYSQLGQLPQAVQFCQQSVQMYEQLKDQVKLSTALLNLGIVYYEQGEWTQASQAYHRSLTIKQEIGDIYGQGQVSNNLGNLHMDRGNWEQALHLFQQSLDIWQEIGAKGEEANTLSNLSQLYLHRDEWDQAQACLKQSQNLFAEIGSEEFLSELERRWSEFYLKTHHLDLALAYAHRSVERAVANGDQLEEGMSRRMLGLIQRTSGHWLQAETNLQQSLDILTTLNSEYEVAKTKLGLAQLWVDTHREAQAETYLVQAITVFEKLETQPDVLKVKAVQKKINQLVMQSRKWDVRLTIETSC